MTNEKIKAALDWIGDIHANILIAFATAEQSHEAHKEAGKAISAIETLRALLEAQTSAGGEIEAAIQDLESNVRGCGSISDYSENSLETVLDAARRYATLSRPAESVVKQGFPIPVGRPPTTEEFNKVLTYVCNKSDLLTDFFKAQGSDITGRDVLLCIVNDMPAAPTSEDSK